MIIKTIIPGSMLDLDGILYLYLGPYDLIKHGRFLALNNGNEVILLMNGTISLINAGKWKIII